MSDRDGDFNKDYDRKKTVKSLTRFLENPLGDTPWEEEDGAEDVRHINTDGVQHLKHTGRR
jgi:hypothetical protein